MTQPTAVSDVEVNGFVLSVTTRMCSGDTPQLLQALTDKTLSAWLWIASLLENGAWDTTVAIDSVEEKFSKDNNLTLADAFGDARVTIWATWRSKKALRFMLNSNDKPQDAVAAHNAHVDGIKDALVKWYEKHPQDDQQSGQEASNSSAANTQGANTQAPATFTDGAIVATRLPTPSTPQYADGQLVSFTIVKIEAGADKGSPVFKLWSSLGGKYASHTIYKLDTKGQVKKDYEAMLPVLNAIKLDFEHPEAKGTWRLVVKAAHSEKDGKTKEYQNLVSITPI